MGKGLTDAQIDAFRRDGVVFPVRLYPQTEAAQFRSALEAIEASRAGRLPPALNAKPHLLIPWLWDMVHNPGLLDAIEDLLGADLLCGPDNGGVQIIPGSHAQILPHRDSGDRLNMLGRREEVIGGVDQRSAIDVRLRPGEMSLHDPLIVHGSPPNQSSERRIGFAMRYIPATVAQRSGARNFATLVRGRDHGHFQLEQAPAAPFHPDALRHHGESIRHGMAVIFDKGDHQPGPSAPKGLEG